MRYVLNDNTVKKFREYGINVWGISSDLDDYEIANKAIDQTAAYFKEMGLPSTLTEVGIGTEKLDIMAQKAASALEHAYMPLTAEQVKEIYMAAL